MVDRDFLNDLEEQQAIDEIVNKGFVGRKGAGGWKKQLVAVVAVVMIGIPIFGMAFPALAQQIPIIGRIFAMIESDYEDFSRLEEFSHEVNITGEVNGMSITIEETVFDGQTVYFTYIVESDSALGDNFHFNISDLGLKVDGIEVHGNRGWGASPGVLQQVSDYTHIAVGSVSFPSFYEQIENAMVHFRMSGWNVSFPIEVVEGEIISLNETVSVDGFEATITNVTILPIGTTLHFSYEMAPGYYTYVDWDFFVYSDETERLEAEMRFRVRDDLGNVYEEWEMMGSHDGYQGDGWIRFKEVLHPNASALIVTPYMHITHWQLGSWEFRGESSIGAEEVIAGGGSVEHREVVLEEIVISLP